MVLIVEIVVLLGVAGIGVWWFLHSPIHKARKNSGAFPPQVSGHMGFGMYTPSNPPLLPHGLHDHRQASAEQQQAPSGEQPGGSEEP
jgi:hypothetical protein